MDENALICDLAETYHIFDYRSLPAFLAATLAAGLSDNSRIKRRITGVSASQETILMAVIADRLGLIIYAMCGGRGEAPEGIAEKYFTMKKKETAAAGFESPEAFKAAWKDITGG